MSGTEFSVLLAILAAMLAWGGVTVIRRMHPPGTCSFCGYQLRGIESIRCPECGHERDDGRRPFFNHAYRPVVRLVIAAIAVFGVHSALLFGERYLPAHHEAVYQGQLLPTTLRFSGSGTGWTKARDPNPPIPEPDQLEFTLGEKAVVLTRDDTTALWVFRDSGHYARSE